MTRCIGRLSQFSAFVFFSVFFPATWTSAFVVKQPIVVQTIGLGLTRQKCRLNAVVMPAEQEDEKKKKKKGESTSHNANHQEQSGSGDWTTTRGGFIPNILKRKGLQNLPKVHLVDDIHDYKDIVVDEKEQIVVVRFFASWCRSCRATKPMFTKLVRTFADSSIKFVEVPLTKETAYLQEGLGVPSVPFAHIYHPEVGLVEEMKVSKPHFKDFSERLNSYVVGSCDLPLDETEDDVLGAFE